ncbi:hypothetical protein [Gordonia otitidis]|uniref:hypothetical protein n=1 Tax=Gordonia otitidis TaxID=249058 RepID=UPI00030BBD9E|nr:hypothetical protein [Gordonia otitidis]
MTTDAHVDDSPDTTTDVSATTVDGATTSSTGATVTDAGTAGDPEIGTGAQYETGAEPDGSPETVGDTETADAPKKVKKKSGAAKKQKAKSGSGKSGGEKSGSAKSGGKSSVVEKPSARAQVVEYLNPRRHPAVTVLSAVCVAALIAVAVLATLLAQRSTDLTAERRLTADKQTAETVAGNYAVGAATFDFNDLKPWSAALKKGTAAELNSRFDVAVNTLTPTDPRSPMGADGKADCGENRGYPGRSTVRRAGLRVDAHDQHPEPQGTQHRDSLHHHSRPGQQLAHHRCRGYRGCRAGRVVGQRHTQPHAE